MSDVIFTNEMDEEMSGPTHDAPMRPAALVLTLEEQESLVSVLQRRVVERRRAALVRDVTTAALLVGYPLAIADKFVLELGAGFTFTPVPFEDAMAESKSANLIAVMANVSAVYQVAPKFSLRGDLGAGLLLFSGVSESPFTDFAETTGTLSMPHVRIGVSGDYAITPNVIATLTPFAFSFSPGKEGLRVEGKDISAITSIDFMVGVGYRM